MKYSDFEIRHSTLADVDIIVELAISTFRETYYPLCDHSGVEDYIANNFTSTQIRRQLSDNGSTVLISQKRNEPVGYAHLRSVPAPAFIPGAKPLELSRFYLKACSIGIGYGSLFMEAVIEEALRLSCDSIWLGVYSENKRAVGFYEAKGFVEVGRREFEFGGRIYDDPLMARMI